MAKSEEKKETKKKPEKKTVLAGDSFGGSLRLKDIKELMDEVEKSNKKHVAKTKRPEFASVYAKIHGLPKNLEIKVD